MRFKEKIKLFWKENKNGYLWSCLAFTILAFLLGLIGKKPVGALSIGILTGFPLMFLMGFGICDFTGGFKE